MSVDCWATVNNGVELNWHLIGKVEGMFCFCGSYQNVAAMYFAAVTVNAGLYVNYQLSGHSG